jgi:hypothetical protein
MASVINLQECVFWHRNSGEVYVKDVKVGGAAAAAGVQPDRKEIRKILMCGTVIL